MSTAIIDLKQIKNLRKEIRKKRRGLTRYQLAQSQNCTVNRLLKCPELINSEKIGVYLDAFGEVPTKRLIHELFKRRKQVYLPLVCTMDGTLHWQRIGLQQWRNRRFALHHLGMMQAMHTRGQLIHVLDCVIMPLVIFDNFGNRVGMGGGFYDRTLAKSSRKLIRIGYAHDFQKSDVRLETQKWDQKLDRLYTPTQALRFKR